jgi:Sortase domain
VTSRTTVIGLVASLITLVAVPIVWVGHEGQEGWGGGADRTDLAGGAGAVEREPGGIPRPPVSTIAPSTPAPVRTRAAALPITGTARPAVPVELVVGGIDLRIPIVATGVATDGQMQLPADPARIGWYRYGATPGSGRGSVVLGGHLDSRQYGVGPLVRLARTRPGDVIELGLSDGRSLKYRTEAVRNVDKQALALDDVFDRDGPRRLRLVTCGGEYLPDRGGYQQNLVVTAVPAE